MKIISRVNKNLFFISLFCILTIIIIEKFFSNYIVRKDKEQMISAVALAENWLSLVEQIKIQKQGKIYSTNEHKFIGLLGEEYSEITTTLGSYEAKKISLNPYFAALTVKLLNDAGIDTTKIVGVTISGSFPGLAISVLAALQTLKINAILMSSLGASSFGANTPEATWIDMENWLNTYGNMRYRSTIVTLGAEGDSGGGLSNSAIEIMKNAIQRNKGNLYIPNSLGESINKHMQILKNNNVSLLINIGGTHASMGDCIHSINIPNGYNKKLSTCKDSLRGIIFRFAEQGKPVIHFLNIKNLAVKYKIPFDYNVNKILLENLCYEKSYYKLSIIFPILIILTMLYFTSKKGIQ